MIINSKFSSLYLGRKEDWRAPHDRDVCYIQPFGINEEIRIQFIAYTTGFTASYMSENGTVRAVTVTQLMNYADDDGTRLYECLFLVSEVGRYRFTVTNGSDIGEADFSILPDEEISNTILLNYTHRKNEYDSMFLNSDGTLKVFNYRVEGGFYPGDKTQALFNEMFRDQRNSPFQLSAAAYEIATLTIGTKKGVPQWVAGKVNSIFCLSDVMIDGRPAVRNESSIPELVTVGDYYPLYVFKLNVELSNEDRIYSGSGFKIFDKTHNKSFN